MQIRALFGTASLVVGMIGAVFTQLGHPRVEQKLDECQAKINSETFEKCRDALLETYQATKDVSEKAKTNAFNLLMLIGGLVNLSSNKGGKSDEKALKELEKKVSK